MRPLFSMFNVLALLLLGLSGLAYRAVQQPPALPTAPRLQQASQQTVRVTVYYSDSKVQNFVKRQVKVQVRQSGALALAQAAVKAWATPPGVGTGGADAGGAVAVVPPGSAVPQVWLRGEHFVANLPASYAQLNYGVSGERMLLCSLARTLLEQRGKDVQFLMNGQNADTLLGHADLRSPYAREDCADD